MGKSNIEWTDKVWNPVTGCTKVSEGCRNCYAERMSKRLAGRAGYPEDGFKVTLHPEKLEEPLRWKKPSRIFVCSMGDLFHKDVPDEVLDQVFAVMALSRPHTFLVLTKRPERMLSYMTGDRIGILDAAFEIAANRRGDICGHVTRENLEKGPWPLNNIWLGTSVEDQKTADERIPILLQTPAAKRFVSYEPALGPVDFTNIVVPDVYERHEYVHKYVEPFKFNSLTMIDENRYYNAPSKLDWIIMGGESGPGARPMHPDWARSTRDQCKAAGVPFFFKQAGEWVPDGEVPFKEPKEANKVIPMYTVWSSAGAHERGRLNSYHIYDKNGQGTRFKKVGKARAGCLLDGKKHKEFPE